MPEIKNIETLTETPHASVFDSEQPRTVRLELDEGDCIARHRHPDSIIILFVVSGELDISLGDGDHQLVCGDVARFDGDQEIAPRARSDCTVLAVFTPKPSGIS